MMADDVAVDGGTPGGCRARQAWNAGGYAEQDAHVNTSATRFSGAPPDGAARAGGRFVPLHGARSALRRSSFDPRAPLVPPLSGRPIGPHSRLDGPQWMAVAPASAQRRRPPGGRAGRSTAIALGRRRAKRPPRPRTCRLLPRVLPIASVHAAAPCQNSRSSSRRHGAPSFRFVCSQGSPCRHCSGLV